MYVAGSIEAFEEVRVAQAIFQYAGHVITHDWTAGLTAGASDGDLTGVDAIVAAEYDLRGVLTADIVVALWHPRLFGTLIEIGVAISHRTQVLLTIYPPRLGAWRQSVFFSLSDVAVVPWSFLPNVAKHPDLSDRLRVEKVSA